MAEISVQNLNKYFGESHILKGLSFEVMPGEKAAIVGANGCGKTTLFRIISGKLDHDEGEIVIPSGARVGMLEQLFSYGDEVTVRQVLWDAFKPIEKMGRQAREMEERMSRGEDVDMAKYSRIQTAFETAGGYELDVRYNIMTNGLKIDADMQSRAFESLSGGEKTRVALAKIMLESPDILLLDEPTNHLDMDSIKWLEDYIRAFKGSAIIISHDRYFLDRTTTKTIEIDDGKSTVYPGNYSYYIDARQERMEQLEKAQKRQQKEIEKLEFTVERMKGWGLGNKRVMKRAFAMEKRLNRIERIQTMRKEHKMHMKFTQAEASGDDVFYFENFSIGYDRPLVKDFSARVFKGERIAILGANGCGKTTFLNTVLKNIQPLSGRVYEGVGLKYGYLPQMVTFDQPQRTILDTILYETHCDVQQARDRLALYEFKGEEVFKTVDVLSGGEKTRLKLCIFMNNKINTMFLDEPTNHLDILSKEWIEEAIDEFSETMIFVSHDRYFINRFATRIWYIENGEIKDFIGTYDEYQAAREREEIQAQKIKQAAPEIVKKSSVQKSKDKQAKDIARRIKSAENEISELNEEIERCAQDYVKLSELYVKKEELEDSLLELYEAAEELG